MYYLNLSFLIHNYLDELTQGLNEIIEVEDTTGYLILIDSL